MASHAAYNGSPARSALLFGVAVGCGARTELTVASPATTDASAPPDAREIVFPVGRYTRCAQGVHDAAGRGGILNVSGIQSGAVLTLSQRGSTLTAEYDDQLGLRNAFEFALTTSSSAVLASFGQRAAGLSIACAQGPGSTRLAPATLRATVGALTYSAGAVFVSLEGTLDADAASPCAAPPARADLWIVCEIGDGFVDPTIDAGAPPPAPTFAVGEYACSSQVSTRYQSGRTTRYVTASGAGALTLDQRGATVSARYSGDPSVSGALRFALTTAVSARAEADQSLAAPCQIPMTAAAPARLSLTAGSIMVGESTLFLSFLGPLVGGACPGAEKVGCLLCVRR
ncbi:MAG: hypothetical protein U0326_33480 [Polyangiales bacterium]